MKSAPPSLEFVLSKIHRRADSLPPLHEGVRDPAG